jgi:hypothetical protein
MASYNFSFAFTPSIYSKVKKFLHTLEQIVTTNEEVEDAD